MITGSAEGAAIKVITLPTNEDSLTSSLSMERPDVIEG